MRRKRACVITFGVAGLAVGTAPAMADTRASLTVSADASAASNPFKRSGDPPAGYLVSTELRPSVTLAGPRSSLSFDGNIRVDRYLQDYGTDVSGVAAARYSRQFSSQTGARANLSFRSSSSVLRDQLLRRDNLIDPTPPPPLDPIVPDPTLVGLRARTNVLNASAGVTHRTGMRSLWTLDGGYQQSWVRSGSGVDFNYINGQFGYSHQLSSVTSLNASVRAGSSDYAGRRTGDAVIITPQVGISTSLGPRWTVSLQGGMALARIDQDIGPKLKRTDLSGSLRLCNRGEYQVFCLSGARATQPTLDGVVRAVTSVAFDYQRQLNEHDSLGFVVQYNRTDGGREPGTSQTPHYTSAGADYSRQFDRRLQGFVSAGVDKALRSTPTRPANFRARLGIRYVIGRLQ